MYSDILGITNFISWSNVFLKKLNRGKTYKIIKRNCNHNEMVFKYFTVSTLGWTAKRQ